ncbi:FAD-dependent oxidoreductase [Nocardia mangyaensis]|uniref:FAD-dependent oxidoreductase n=1 Tax=Nocardia mangyaensis TaxID=2213200 RepID=UPI0034612BCB
MAGSSAGHAQARGEPARHHHRVGLRHHGHARRRDRGRALLFAGRQRLVGCVVHLPNAEFTAAALESLAKHYPEVAEAEVLRTHVIHQPQATFSAQPGFDELRLPQRTPIEGLFLAGDWTETGMPSTMEAAAESAVRAVDAVGEHLGTRSIVIENK